MLNRNEAVSYIARVIVSQGEADAYAAGRYSSPWSDLPVGSFSESGTNINTTVLTVHRRD